LLRVNGTIDGRIDVQFTLDSGSTVSLMSKRIAQANGLKIMPSEIKIKSANNAVTPVVGVTEALSVDIQGHTCPIIMVIMEHDDHEVLLGLDWFMVTGASLHPKFKVLRFPGVSVPLESHNEEQWNINEFDDVEEVLALEVADASDIEGDTDWYIDNDIKMEPSEKLNQNERIKFDELKKVATRSFATNYDSLGCCTLSKHEIRLLSRNPVYSHPYRKSGKERDNIKEEVDKLLKAKIIRPSRSPYASPVILIPKKDGTNRMCVDYRKLNLQTIPEQWPLPRITDILDGMVGSSWFTMIDLKNGYYQIAMSASSIEKTAFVTPDGHYEFLRLPFGLKNAPSHFSKIMQQTLGDLSFVKIYLDDITIHSETFDLHITHVKTAIGRLQESNLKLNGAKCTWFSREISLLGHIVNIYGISMDMKKIDAILKMLAPKNVKQVQIFLGLGNYYRRFICEFAKIIKPIATLLQKDVKFLWSEECQIAFDTIKKLLQ